MQSHAVAPDGSPALHNHEGAAGDVGERRQRLGRSDGRRDGDGVDDERQSQLRTFLPRLKVLAVNSTSSELAFLASSSILAIFWSFSPSIILQL